MATLQDALRKALPTEAPESMGPEEDWSAIPMHRLATPGRKMTLVAFDYNPKTHTLGEIVTLNTGHREEQVELSCGLHKKLLTVIERGKEFGRPARALLTGATLYTVKINGWARWEVEPATTT